MRRTLIAAGLILGLALPASAATCLQSDGQPGIKLVGIEGDAGCQTAEEYQQVFSAPNLLDVGAIVDYTVNGDGTTTLDFGNGVENTVVSNPLDRPVSANPELEPDAPTVGEVLYPRLAFGVHPA